MPHLQSILDAAEDFVLEVALPLLEHGLLALSDAPSHGKVLGELVIVRDDLGADDRSGQREIALLPDSWSWQLDQLVGLVLSVGGDAASLIAVSEQLLLLGTRHVDAVRRRRAADLRVVEALQRLRAILHQHPRADKLTQHQDIYLYTRLGQGNARRSLLVLYIYIYTRTIK